MANPIKRGFSKLTQFSGRDSRGEFWPYAAAVFGLFFLGNFILMASLIGVTIAGMAPFVAASPAALALQSSPREYVVLNDAPAQPPEIFNLFFAVYPVLILVIVLLLAAAVVRRLHDRNMAGFWGLLPVPFLAVGMTALPVLMGGFSSGTPRFDLIGLLAINNLLYLIALGTLIVLLAMKGTPGPNRYGADPVAVAPDPRNDWSASS